MNIVYFHPPSKLPFLWWAYSGESGGNKHMGCYFKSKRTEKKNFQPTQPSQLPIRTELELSTHPPHPHPSPLCIPSTTFLPEVIGLCRACCLFLWGHQMFRMGRTHCYPNPASCLPLVCHLCSSIPLSPCKACPRGGTTKYQAFHSLILSLLSSQWTPFSVIWSKISKPPQSW